jgi:pimeloyl-ACP methyl ester carboxylesterase
MAGLLDSHLFRPPPPSYGPSEAVLYAGVPCVVTPAGPRHVVYLHGNAYDAGTARGHTQKLAAATGCTIVAVEYPGYGVYRGVPSVQGACRAAALVYEYVSHHNSGTVLMGRSLGSGIAAHIASQYPPQYQPTLVLLSPYASMERIVAERYGAVIAWAVAGGVLDTASAMARVSAPTLVVHGLRDEVIPPAHACAALANGPSANRQILWLRHSGHDLDWDKVCAGVKAFLGPPRE